MIKKISRQLFGNLVLKGSFLVLASSVLANLGAYLFHLFCGRLLGPADYGVLESLIALAYFLSIPLTVLTLLVTKFVSQNNQRKEKVVSFLKIMSIFLAKAGLGILAAFLLLFPFLRQLVKIDSFGLFFGVGLISYLGIFSAVLTASLQGLMEFFRLGIMNVFGSWTKLLLAVVLVLFGFKVGGVVLGMFLSSLLSLALGYFILRSKLPLSLSGQVKTKESFGGIGRYALAVFVANLSLTSIYTVDIVLARYFLPAVAAGQYAALSVLGKIVFFASSSITLVMFPIVSAREAEGKDYQKVILLSLGLVMAISFLIALAYFLFPELMISLLFGRAYLAVAGSLGIFAVFIGVYSLCSLLVNFFLSISRTRYLILPGSAALLQIVLIFFFHQSITEILRVNLLITSLLLAGLLLCFGRNYRRNHLSPAS